MGKGKRAAGPRVVVVGGGPAGMMAAIQAAGAGAAVTLLERNPSLGKKLLLTGKGRCNLTNACDLTAFLARIAPQGQFLRDAFKAFFNQELMRFFTERGVALKVERQQRVFPVSDRSVSILRVLQDEISRQGVVVRLGVQASDLLRAESGVRGVLLAGGEEIPAERVVWASGGRAYPQTGSDGAGVDLARRWGHRVVALRPGLVPLQTRQALPAAVSGLSLKNIRLHFRAGKKALVTEVGEMLFTHDGISGPLVLSASGWVVDRLAEGTPVGVAMDLKPALSVEQLVRRLAREGEAHPRRGMRTLLQTVLPRALIDPVLAAAGVPAEHRAGTLPDRQRADLAGVLKGLRLDITGTPGFAAAMVTQGGVALKDVDPRTMASRVVPGLFFAGEILDLAGDTGGFNLQAAFSTGYLAGQKAARPLA